MLTTTFRLAREADACPESYKAVAKALGGIKAYGQDTPVPLARILELQGLGDALWCLRYVIPEQQAEADKLARLFACDCAEHVLPLFEKEYPGDKRPRQAIEVARQYAKGEASTEELRAAAWVAGAAARDVAGVASRAAWAASRAAAKAAGWDAARAAAWDAAWDAAWAAGWVAARDAERVWQTKTFLEMLKG